MNPVVSFIALFGGLILASRTLSIVKSLYVRFIISPKHPLVYGKWAVITGATDGIGKAIAFEMAKKGCNLILISRTLSKLEDTKKEILSLNSGISVELLDVDYSQFSLSSESFTRVEKLLGDTTKDVGILVNNVGMSYPFPKYFHELSNEECMNLISLNVTSTTLMTKLFMDLKTQDSTKKRLVINIGSFAGIFPSPLLAEYSAAKAYVETLTRSLSVEYEGSAEFQCHVPLYIVSKMSKIRRGSMMVPTSEEYAKLVISNIGKGVVVSPHFLQSLTTEILKQIPYDTLMSRVKGLHLGIRAKGFRKLEREKKS